MPSMKLKFCKAIACGALVMLVTGCSQTTTQEQTRTVETSITRGVCSVWLPVTYSSGDTAQTQLEARQNNAARDAYCA